MEERSNQIRRRDTLRRLFGIACGASTVSVVGCSKILLSSGKILFGDPKVQSEFTKFTHEDLTKGTKTVLVICSTPESVEDDIASLKLDIIDGLTRRLRLKGVKTINPDRVADWIDNHDGIVAERHLNELARDFDTDFIIWIDVESFALYEPNSPKLLRGQTTGHTRVYNVKDQFGQRMANRFYQTGFRLMYPEHQAVSSESRSLSVFHKDYLNHLCDVLAERFYDHRPGSRI